MTFLCGICQKRFCDNGAELLRVVLSLPKADGEGGADVDARLSIFFAFYGEIENASLRFAEDRLFPSIKTEYAGLSPHDRKFHIPKRTYEVTASVTELPSENGSDDASSMLCVTLTAMLKRRGSIQFEAVETQYFAERNGVFLLVPPPKEDEVKRQKKKQKKKRR